VINKRSLEDARECLRLKCDHKTNPLLANDSLELLQGATTDSEESHNTASSTQAEDPCQNL
jgi:hypothetical protein